MKTLIFSLILLLFHFSSSAQTNFEYDSRGNVTQIKYNGSNGCPQSQFVFTRNVVVDVPDKDGVSLFYYPNPTTGLLWLKYSVNKPGTVDLALFTAEGQLIKNIVSSEQVQQGSYIKEIQMSEFPAGLYFFVFILNGEKYLAKIVKLN